MVYETPRAAHFDAFRGEEMLHGLDPVGLRARWAVANRLKCDMLHLRTKDREAIKQALAEVNTELAPHGIEVRERDRGQG